MEYFAVFWCCLMWFGAGVSVGSDYPNKAIWLASATIAAATVIMGL